MVIVRENMNGAGNKTYLLKVRYVSTDSKKVLKKFLQFNPKYVNVPVTKVRITDLFFSQMLGYLPKKSAMPIAEWFFNMAIQEGYIMEMPTLKESSKEYTFNYSVIFSKPGPKPKKNKCK